MPTDWNYQEGSTAYRRWIRSRTQTIHCPLGQPPSMVASLEEVRIDADGTVLRVDLVELPIRMAELRGEDLADALEIQARLTALLGRRYLAWVEAQREVEPEAPVAE